MAVGKVTVVSLVDELAVIFDDDEFQLFTKAEYTRFILTKIVRDEAEYTFKKASTGFYYYNPQVYLWNPTYTPSDDTSGTLHALGSIEITSGTEVATAIVVTGTPVNFGEVVVACCKYAATNRAQQASQTIAGGGFSVEDTQKKLMEMSTYWRGVRGAGY